MVKLIEQQEISALSKQKLYKGIDAMTECGWKYGGQWTKINDYGEVLYKAWFYRWTDEDGNE